MQLIHRKCGEQDFIHEMFLYKHWVNRIKFRILKAHSILLTVYCMHVLSRIFIEETTDLHWTVSSNCIPW